jgi:hypothetical protein
MIEFHATDSFLYLIYRAEDGREWVEDKLRTDGVTLKRTFRFNRQELVDPAEIQADDANEEDFGVLPDPDDAGTYYFRFGERDGSYYRVPGRRLAIAHDLFIAHDYPVDVGDFVAHRNISIFGQIDRLVDQDIYIGGTEPGAVPIPGFEALIKSFPNSTELDHYARARIARALRDYLGTLSPAEASFEAYLGRKRRSPRATPSLGAIVAFEKHKYIFLRDRIGGLLREENAYSENEWRDLMLQFLLLIFPKYVAVLKNVRLKDFYTVPGTVKNRILDIALVDANGHLDVIEIKKPFANALVSEGQYRDSFTPRRELSGAIMQAEKYLFHLSKWGVEGERDINTRQRAVLPAGLNIRITNPKAIVIAGRSNNLSRAQLADFEFMKRKYANVVDILSYDDLLERLTRTIERFSPSS